MPLTYLSHQAAVLPLKMLRPAWFALPASVLVTMVARRQEPRLLAALPWQPVWLRHLARCEPRSRSLSVVVACAALGVLTHLLQHVSTVGGALVTIVLLVVIGRRRSVLDWRPQQRTAMRSRPDRRVYAVSAVAAAVGLVCAGDAHGDVAAAVNRLMLTAGAGYVAAVTVFITDTLSANDSEEQT